MASMVVLTYPDREGAEQLAGLLREIGVAAAAVPEEDERFPGRMVWRVRVPEADAAGVASLLEGLARPERP